MKDLIKSILQSGDTKKDILLGRTGLTDRKLRKLISEMPEVGSCHHRGYFLIKSQTDLNDSLRDLKSKAKSLFKRAELQHTNFGMSFQPEMIFK